MRIFLKLINLLVVAKAGKIQGFQLHVAIKVDYANIGHTIRCCRNGNRRRCVLIMRSNYFL